MRAKNREKQDIERDHKQYVGWKLLLFEPEHKACHSFALSFLCKLSSLSPTHTHTRTDTIIRQTARRLKRALGSPYVKTTPKSGNHTHTHTYLYLHSHFYTLPDSYCFAAAAAATAAAVWHSTTPPMLLR